MTRLPATLGALTLTGVGALTVAAPSVQAQDVYRYWAYWYATQASWEYATEGSGTRVPADGDIEGWRFGFADAPDAITPITAPDFDSICGNTPPPDQGKRIGLVIEPGDDFSAPAGESPPEALILCVTAETAATGYQILTSVVAVRTDAGFVCGIDGYPAHECAPVVELPQESSTIDVDAASELTTSVPDTDAVPEPPHTGDVGTPVITAISLSLIALGGFGLWRRSRRKAPQ